LEAHYLPPALDDEQIVDADRMGQAPGGQPSFPHVDYHASILAKHREELSSTFASLGSRGKPGRIVDKAQNSRICHSRLAGCLAPMSLAGGKSAKLAEELSFPCLIKPNRSFNAPFPPKLKNSSPIARRIPRLLPGHPELMGCNRLPEIIEGGDENASNARCWFACRRSGEPCFVRASSASTDPGME